MGTVVAVLAVTVLSVAAAQPVVLVTLLIVGIVVGWLWLLNRDHVDGLTVFLVLVPLWVYLKWFEWPTVVFLGRTFHVATTLKEVLLVAFFGHWFITSIRDDGISLRVFPGLVGYFAVVTLALLRAGLFQFPMLVRPYVEMFLLVSVPLLGMELDEDDVERLLHGLIAGCGLVSVIALYHAFIDPQFLLSEALIQESIFKTKHKVSANFGLRLQSIAGNPNNLAQIALVGSVASMAFLLGDRHRGAFYRRLGYGAVFTSSTFVLMLARDRDGIALFVLVLAILVVLNVNRRMMVILSAIGGLAILFNRGDIVGAYHILIEQGNPRFDYWRTGIRFFGSDLLFGVGDVENEFARTNPYDSSYFRMVVQVGIVGLLFFVIYNARAVVGLVRESTRANDRTLPLALLVVLVVLLGGSTFRVSIFVFPFTLIYWLVFALAVQYVAFEPVASEQAVGSRHVPPDE